jgi:lysozyme
MGFWRSMSKMFDVKCKGCGYEYVAEPAWYTLAKTQVGQKEIYGDKDNPKIIEYLMATTYREPVMHDEIPWCAALVFWCLKYSNCETPKELQAWARTYATVGTKIDKPQLGCIVTIQKTGEDHISHVTFFDHIEGEYAVCLGGNQSNEVKYSKYLLKECHDFRWPVKLQTTQPKPTPATQLKGIDVSHWQPTVDWHKHKQDGVAFAFCKATEGETFIDSCFLKHFSDMKANGIIRGCYHYLRINRDAIEQANHFWNTVKPVWQKTDLPLVCDFEAHDDKSKAEIKDCVLAFLSKVKELSGKTPIVYTGKWFIDEYVGECPELANYPLWAANYTESPRIPKPWTKCDFWQFTNKPQDTNIFYGSLADLKKKFNV